jgi:hypothetical protein
LGALTFVKIGASYVNPLRTVPTIELTVRRTSSAAAVPVLVIAFTDEYVVHETVPTTEPPRIAVGVASSAPKFIPNIVTSPPPELGPLMPPRLDMTGASYEKNVVAAQPTIAEIVKPRRTPGAV